MVQNIVSNQEKKIRHNSATNITIKKMTEMIVSNKILDVTGNKGVTHLLRNFKCTSIVVESGYPFINTPHSTRFVLSDTNTNDNQHYTEIAT